MDQLIKDYIEKLVKEKEYLCARYIDETGYDIADVCMVEHETEKGRVFYPDLKKKYESDLQSKLSKAEELIGKLEESAREVIGCELRMFGVLSRERRNNMSTAIFLLNEALEEIAKWRDRDKPK